MDPVEAICFDLDDTLCADTASGSAALEGVCRLAAQRLGLQDWHPIASLYGIVSDLLYSDFMSWGRGLDRLEVRRQVWTATLRTGNYANDALALELAQHHAQLRTKALCWLPGAQEVLAALKGRYRLGLITNGASQIQREKIDALGLTAIFETVVVAEECGFSKPQPEIFQVALRGLRARASHALMVGDRADADIVGAQRVGMRGVWVAAANSEWPLAEDEPWQRIERVSELPTLLGNGA